MNQQYTNEDLNNLLTYDLSSNYFYGESNKSLQEICCWTVVLESYKCDEAVQEFKRMILDQDQEDNSNLFRIVENNVVKTDKLPTILKSKIRLVIQLVYDEITRFLLNIFLITDKLLFVGNFIFNSQGGINPRETVLQVLRANIFSTREQFEFSCKYLFDEEIIKNYFIELIPYNIDCYFLENFSNPSQIPIELISIWVYKFSIYDFLSLEEQEEDSDIDYFNNLFYNSNFEFIALTELSVHYSFENLEDPSNYFDVQNLLDPSNYAFFVSVLDRLMLEPVNHRINISIYLITRLGVDTLFDRYAYAFLIKLVKNSRWYDIFIRLFRILNIHVPTRRYLSLTYIVLMEMWSLIKMEGNHGKYNNIWREFDELVLNRRNNYMKNWYRIEYAKKVFEIFKHQEVRLVNLFLSVDIDNNDKIGITFYELSKNYFKLFADSCCECSDIIETFLTEIIKLEDKVSYLLTRLYLKTPYLLHAAKLRGILLWYKVQPFMEWYLNMSIIEEIRITNQYLCLKNRFAISEQSSLKALTKIEYAEQFLTFKLINNQLLIFHKGRFVKNIRIYSRERYASMFLNSLIRMINANRF